MECRPLAALLRRIPQGEDFVFVSCFGFRISNLSAQHSSASPGHRIDPLGWQQRLEDLIVQFFQNRHGEFKGCLEVI